MKRAAGRLSIRLKLLLTSTVVQVIMLSLLLANSVRLMNDATTASLKTLITQNAAILNVATVKYSSESRYGELQDTLEELLRDASEGLVYVRIADANGQLLVSAGLPALRELPAPDEEDGVSLRASLKRDLINVRRPLLLQRNEVGYLQFGVSVSPLILAKKAIVNQGLLIAVGEILLTVALLGVLGYFMTRKLGRLLRGSQAIARGDLTQRLPEDGDDELARLCRHFNSMSASLQARVDELETTARKLTLSEERYALASRAVNDGLWDWDIAKNSAYFAPRFAEILGIQAVTAEHTSRSLFEHIHSEDRESFRLRLIAHFKGDLPQFIHEHRILRGDGTFRWVLTRGLAVRDASGRAVRMVGSISDVHLRKRAEEQLLHDALHDGLTGLANRALFVEHLQKALSQAARKDGNLFAVLHVNIERFHVFNDSLGYAAGDALLQLVAARIESMARPGDVVGRVGGDQFAVLLNDIADPAEAVHFTEELQGHLAEATEFNGHVFYPKTRIGVALGNSGFHSAEDLMRDADNAMHRARSSTEGTITVFQADMHQEVLRDLRLESELREALRDGQLQAHFQPIVELGSGRLRSFEVLVRWPALATRRIGPDIFIPLAESLGLIHELGMQMLTAGCLQLKAWRDAGLTGDDLTISVNLSVRQFQQPGLAAEITRRITDCGLPPQSVKLEVTEGILVDRHSVAPERLADLRAGGLPIRIGDFGTGYSSLSYLHTIPCDTLKLDGSFIRDIVQDDRLRAIVGASIGLAHDLGMTVVAECIERQDQADLLHTLGCDFGQGYLYARPGPGAEAQAWLHHTFLPQRSAEQ